MDPKIAISIVELEEQLGNGKWLARRHLSSRERHGETSQRERDGEEQKQARVVDRS